MDAAAAADAGCDADLLVLSLVDPCPPGAPGSTTEEGKRKGGLLYLLQSDKKQILTYVNGTCRYYTTVLFAPDFIIRVCHSFPCTCVCVCVCMLES